MNLSRPFIERPIMTTLVMITLAMLGINAFLKMPVSNLPDVNFPTITVKASFPGANPQTMANTVATPLEKQFMTIPGIKSVVSSNTLGATSIVLQFDIDKDIDLAAVDVNTAIAAAKGLLPPDLPQDPTFKKVNPSSSPIMYIAVTSKTMTQGELYDYANTLVGQRISIIEGVSQVSVYGSPKAVRVQLDPGQMARMGLSQADVATAIAKGNQYQPLGGFDGQYLTSLIYDNGGLLKADDYGELIAAFRNGAPVKILDIASVQDSLKSDRISIKFLTQDLDQVSVTLGVQRQPGANAVKIADEIYKLLPKFKEQLPGSLDLVIIFDRAEMIKESLFDVQLTLVIALILVVAVIFVYLGKAKETIIPSIVMPISIIATFAVIERLGYSIDTLSLLAITLAIGFIVDDAIVVLENIVRRVETGESPTLASINGSKQIGFTILSMTLSLVAVFLPLIFMGGLIGKLFQEFSITLAIITIVSGIISLTLTPMLCSRFIAEKQAIHKGRLAAYSDKMNQAMLRHYEKALKVALDHRKIILFIGVLSVLISALLFKILKTDFIPDEDIGFIQIYTEAEQGTSSLKMQEYHHKILDILKKEEAIVSITSNAATPSYRQGVIFVQLTESGKRPKVKELIQDYSAKLKVIPGVNTFFKNVSLIDLNIGTQVRGAYQYFLRSLDAEKLYKSSENLIQKLKSDPIFQDISTDLEIKTPEIDLQIDRKAAAALGVDMLSFETSLALGYSGNRVSRIQTPIDQYDVIVELNRDLQRSPSSLNDIYLPSAISSDFVPLSAFATWKEGVGPASINHFNQFPSVTITFNVAPDVALSDVIKRLQEHAKETLEGGVTGNVKGSAEVFQESIKSLSYLLVVTVFVIYVILGILYESYIHPITILSTLPPAVAGALLSLYFTGYPLSLYAFLGIILLLGIVKKNGIMIVDFALDNVREKNATAEQSIYDACLIRFRPIMMTTVAAIMGAVPIAIGIGSEGESRRPLGLVIIGGLIVSQLVTLFLTPVIYLYMERFRERFFKNY